MSDGDGDEEGDVAVRVGLMDVTSATHTLTRNPSNSHRPHSALTGPSELKCY